MHWIRGVAGHLVGAMAVFLLYACRFAWGGDDTLLLKGAVLPDHRYPGMFRSHVTVTNRSDRPVYFEPCRGSIVGTYGFGMTTTGPRCYPDERLVLMPGESHTESHLGLPLWPLALLGGEGPQVTVRYRPEPEAPFIRAKAPLIKLPVGQP